MKLFKRTSIWDVVEVDKSRVNVKAYTLPKRISIELSCNRHELRMDIIEAKEMIKQLEEAINRIESQNQKV